MALVCSPRMGINSGMVRRQDPRVNPVELGEGPGLLRRWRGEHDVSLKSLAEQCGYSSHGAIAAFELRKRSLPVSRVVILSNLTGIDPYRLAAPDQVGELTMLLMAAEKLRERGCRAKE